MKNYTLFLQHRISYIITHSYWTLQKGYQTFPDNHYQSVVCDVVVLADGGVLVNDVVDVGAGRLRVLIHLRVLVICIIDEGILFQY